jgi:peptide/nickel transport system substrate-binding protein
MSRIGRLAVVAAAVVSIGLAPPGLAGAQELKIGIKTEPSSLDPQFHTLNPNIQVAQHFFDALVLQDENLKTKPGLALSWKTLDDTTWEFRLRPNVKFHDGSDFTAEDVVFTYERIPKVPNSPGPYTIYTRSMKSFEVVDPLTLRIKTDGPAPLLPLDLAALPILSKKAMAGPAPEGKTSAELNAGNGLVGTGPFKFVEWQRGSRIVGERNDAYWGGKPAWSKVILRPLSNNTARVAALLSGDVDLIEDPPTTDLAKLKNDPKVHLDRAVSNRVIYIHLDQHGDPPIAIPDTNGKNPLMDRRVREALSIAIDRKGIADKIMEGVAVPAGDLLPYPMGGTRKDTPVDAYEPAKARKLLAEAGYPNGFSITLGAPNGRYINDLKIAQAVAAMWSRVGVKTEVDAAQLQVLGLSRRLGRQHRRAQQRAEGAARHARPAARHGHDQLRPLLQQGGGRQTRRGAGHGRRRQARGAAGRREQDRDPAGSRPDPDPLRAVGVGDEEGPQLPGPRRPEHAGGRRDAGAVACWSTSSAA